MLIPSIDLRGGKIVQLVQGERLALEEPDIFSRVRQFARFQLVQLIDLDAAMGTGDHDDLVRQICRMVPCRVGGGIRTVDRARALLDNGARQVILGSALFKNGRVDDALAADVSRACGTDPIVSAVDSRDGRVVIDAWKTRLDITAVDAVHALEPFCGGFLYTHVDTEGLMRGIDFEAVRAVREATIRRVSAAVGITADADIAALEAIGVDAVVGMAI
ncbi:MAG: 1-(5-phosphoribosyl)-5-[(5-phosphoribosylamino)methylideneamino] imidazole-4-carboxamide isomerase, partial [Acidobacteria bacterium]|nr:1-(5-phosphoribosyl)-5-[(5-phosphoribosylamino)methylideneamino] imidazole-4-carboxamide isomerase [Acidobacteriota bacterium]